MKDWLPYLFIVVVLSLLMWVATHSSSIGHEQSATGQLLRGLEEGMSNVTNVILKHGIVSEQTGSLTSRINEFFGDRLGFVNLDEVSDREGNKPYGGTKCLECEVLVGSFNHLDINKLIAHLLTIPWETSEETQLFVQFQEADRMEEVLRFDIRLNKLVVIEEHIP